jgi:hypothetical protein
MASLPIACDPNALSSESFAVHRAEGRRLQSLALERRELPDGWALRMPNDEEIALACASWIIDEGRCCPFFVFALEWGSEPDAVWLRITGPEGAKEILRAELR